jgi:KUP system potassium uptake protein
MGSVSDLARQLVLARRLRSTIIPTAHVPGMWVWREALFAFMQRNAERSAAYFGIPTAQVVEIGIEIEI